MENITLYSHNNNLETFPYNNYYTPIQLKLPLVFDEIIDINDSVCTFVNLMNEVDLRKYLVSSKKNRSGRAGYNPLTLLQVVLYAFQLRGYASTREIEDLCKNDIRFRYLLQYEKSIPSHMTINNFINNYLKDNIENIFIDIMNVLKQKDEINLDYAYIDGTKIEANANKYTWIWKQSCITNRNKLFKKITLLLESINKSKNYSFFNFETKDQYEITYIEEIFNTYINKTNIDSSLFIKGKGKRKIIGQKEYELFKQYLNKLKEYAIRIETCGEHRNSYSKTDKDATFMRIKKDYMGNDQLLPAYNLQYCICNEYIVCLDVNQYASDTDCFVPLMDKFHRLYNKYPTYPVADAGYGSYNNYLYCEEKGMEKYMKFSTYKKETKDKEYINNPFRPLNFRTNEKGNLVCPNNKEFIKKYDKAIKGNKYGRTEEIYECVDCSDCPLKNKCTKAQGNRMIKLNKELTKIHQEVLDNLNSEKGIILRMNRSIQAEGAFGILKQDRGYRRIVRKSLIKVTLEAYLIAIGYNIYKYHNKKVRIK